LTPVRKRSKGFSRTPRLKHFLKFYRRSFASREILRCVLPFMILDANSTLTASTKPQMPPVRQYLQSGPTTVNAQLGGSSRFWVVATTSNANTSAKYNNALCNRLSPFFIRRNRAHLNQTPAP
jgi:hypothetical protein